MGDRDVRDLEIAKLRRQVEVLTNTILDQKLQEVKQRLEVLQNGVQRGEPCASPKEDGDEEEEVSTTLEEIVEDDFEETGPIFDVYEEDEVVCEETEPIYDEGQGESFSCYDNPIYDVYDDDEQVANTYNEELLEEFSNQIMDTKEEEGDILQELLEEEHQFIDMVMPQTEDYSEVVIHERPSIIGVIDSKNYLGETQFGSHGSKALEGELVEYQKPKLPNSRIFASTSNPILERFPTPKIAYDICMESPRSLLSGKTNRAFIGALYKERWLFECRLFRRSKTARIHNEGPLVFLDFNVSGEEILISLFTTIPMEVKEGKEEQPSPYVLVPFIKENSEVIVHESQVFLLPNSELPNSRAVTSDSNQFLERSTSPKIVKKICVESSVSLVSRKSNGASIEFLYKELWLFEYGLLRGYQLCDGFLVGKILEEHLFHLQVFKGLIEERTYALVKEEHKEAMGMWILKMKDVIKSFKGKLVMVDRFSCCAYFLPCLKLMDGDHVAELSSKKMVHLLGDSEGVDIEAVSFQKAMRFLHNLQKLNRRHVPWEVIIISKEACFLPCRKAVDAILVVKELMCLHEDPKGEAHLLQPRENDAGASSKQGATKDHALGQGCPCAQALSQGYPSAHVSAHALSQRDPSTYAPSHVLPIRSIEQCSSAYEINQASKTTLAIMMHTKELHKQMNVSIMQMGKETFNLNSTKELNSECDQSLAHEGENVGAGLNWAYSSYLKGQTCAKNQHGVMGCHTLLWVQAQQAKQD